MESLMTDVRYVLRGLEVQPTDPPTRVDPVIALRSE
ncbi:MAG: hypothetical protein K0S19_567 [Geminicoccaceae bacterium]|jgi:hypothetical protein|nr:hypothetical protein [Geminicoccaceae bacterium]